MPELARVLNVPSGIPPNIGNRTIENMDDLTGFLREDRRNDFFLKARIFPLDLDEAILLWHPEIGEIPFPAEVVPFALVFPWNIQGIKEYCPPCL